MVNRTRPGLERSDARVLRGTVFPFVCALGISALLSPTVPADASAQQPAATGELRGVVVSRADGKPIAGAMVMLVDREYHSIALYDDGIMNVAFKQISGAMPDMSTTRSWTAVTDADGRFALTQIAGTQREFTLGVAHALAGIYVMPRMKLADAESQPTRIELGGAQFIEYSFQADVSRPELRYMLSIQPDNRPMQLPGSGSVEYPALQFSETRPLDESETVRIGPLPAGNYDISLHAAMAGSTYDGLLWRRRVAIAEEPVTKVGAPVAADGGGRVLGRVTGEDGQPMAGANVRVFAAKLGDDSRYANAVFMDGRDILGAITNREGNYELRSLAPGSYRIEVVALSGVWTGSFGALTADNIELRADDRELRKDFLDLHVPYAGRSRGRGGAATTPSSKLRGLVVSKQTGAPLAGYDVAIARTDGGRLSFSPMERWSSVYADGPEQRGVQEAFQASLANPIEMPQLQLNTRTDADGAFELFGMQSPDQPYDIGVARGSRGSGVARRIVPNDYVERELRIELDDPPRLELAGFPALEDPSASVYATMIAVKQPPAVSVDLASLYGDATIFDNIMSSAYVKMANQPAKNRHGDSIGLGSIPAGPAYVVMVQLTQQNRTTTTTALFARLITPKPGETIRLSPPTDGATIAGRITGDDGKPLRDVSVTVRTPDPKALAIGAVTDADGKYELRGVPPGNFPIEITRYGLRTAPG